MRGVLKRDKVINLIFENLKRSRTTNLKLPPNFISLLEPQQQQNGTRSHGGGVEGSGRGRVGGRVGGGVDKGRESKRIKISPANWVDTKKKHPDAWSVPASVANSVATYVSNKGNGKVYRERCESIKFKHHEKR